MDPEMSAVKQTDPPGPVYAAAPSAIASPQQAPTKNDDHTLRPRYRLTMVAEAR